MSKRLIKVAKELNVGLNSIVDFLSSKGFEVESKPTFVVTEAMYGELLVEFKGSIAVKEKADQIVIGATRSASEDTEIEAKPDPAPAKKTSALEALLMEAKSKKNTDSSLDLAAKKEEALEAEGKVAAEASLPVTGSKGDKEELLQEEESLDSSTDKEKGEEEAPRMGIKVVGKIDLSGEGKKRKSLQQKDTEPVVKEDKRETADQNADKESLVSSPGSAKDEGKEEKSSSDAQQVESEETEKKEEDSNYQTVVPQLKGLKVMGKIDTESFAKKKPKPVVKDAPATSSTAADDSALKKKRKRKKITVVSDKAPQVGQPQDRRKEDLSKKPIKKGSQPEKTEVSQKEIEDQIKATMARLSGGGKNKRAKARRDNREKHREKQEALENAMDDGILELTEFITVSELASLLNVGSSDVIMTCMNLGVIVSINQRLDAEIIELIASEFDKEVKFVGAEDQLVEADDTEIDDEGSLEDRAPIVTVMGHVDHGKTSLLDYIRKANVVSGEAGGITQHIGAYEVLVGEDKKKITFLDTPGHEAFTAMRARGAKVTDIAIIIIAADDNIMPQTKEAISHAQAAGVPMIFAINKIDKPGADPTRIKQELSSMNLLVEEWGGKYQSQDISAKNGLNIELLLEKVLLEAEMLELKANPNRRANGTILEASLDKGRGYVAKGLVQNGTLKIGDVVLAGETSGKVKAMFNERGVRIKEAGPSSPVLILGLSGAPQAGELFKVLQSESEARNIATKRSQILREQANRASKRISLDEIGRRLALGTFKELNLIVKGDVDGSIEALSDSLIKLSLETVQVNVIHKAVGQIIESDVLLASASDAIIVGFQVRPSSSARQLAEKEGVQIKTYSIIYEAIEEIKLATEGMLEPTKEEKIIGQLSVREVFKISKVGTIAGCLVDEGKVLRNSNVRVIRDGIVVYPTKEGAVGELASLKRYKDDVKEVRAGMECGMNVKNFNDLKVGDIIEAYEITMVKGKI
jgi:translation initiation factor IF-2